MVLLEIKCPTVCIIPNITTQERHSKVAAFMFETLFGTMKGIVIKYLLSFSPHSYLYSRESMYLTHNIPILFFERIKWNWNISICQSICIYLRKTLSFDILIEGHFGGLSHNRKQIHW